MKLFANKNELLHLKQGIYKLKSNLVKNIISIGISPFLMNACACIIVIFINNQLVKFGGDLAVGAYGVANSIAMIFIMFVIGLNQGMQPIAGYNYGAQKYDRMMQVVKLSIITATCIMFIGWSLAMFAPYYCVRLFTKDPELIQRSIKAISIIMMMYPFIGCQMVITNFFQCIGKVKVSIFLSLSRQLLFLLPLLVIFPNFYNVNGVWAAIPTSDFIAVVVSITIMTIYLRRLKKEQKEYKAI